MWKYDQSSGDLTLDGKYITTGYSGRDAGKNNPALQAAKSLGPIPSGQWLIVGPPYNSKNVGPFVLKVFAKDGVIDDTHKPTGRGSFRIHGDKIRDPGNASHGCIILSRAVREMIWRSKDYDLEVAA